MAWSGHLSQGAAALQGTFHRNGPHIGATWIDTQNLDGPVGSGSGSGSGGGHHRRGALGAVIDGSGSDSASGRIVGPHPSPDCYFEGLCNLPYNQPCFFVDLQRPGPTDPASRIQIGDVERWASWGQLSDKVFINTVKMQGAMEMLAALGATVPSATAALSKNVGGAQTVVSRQGADGTQGFQNYGVYAYDKGVPATGAVSIVPVAYTRAGF